MEYIDLNRHFFRFHSANEWELSRLNFGAETPLGALNWEMLLNEWRVVVLAEGGAGKTEEFRHKASQLRDEGIPAFYVTVNALSERPLERALANPDARNQLRDWMKGDGVAHFFVDSVDEARLHGKDLANGLDSLASGLEGALHRAKIILSCRVLDWRHVEDMNAFQSILRAPSPSVIPGESTKAENPNDAWLRPIFRDNANEKEETPRDASEADAPLIVSLGPLTRAQASKLASAAGVQDEAEFINAVVRADAEDLGNRPLDLIDLSRMWIEERRIGSRAEIIAWSIQRRLQETNRDRRRRDRLSLEEAMSAAQNMAAALTMCRSRLIAWPAGEADAGEGEAAIDPGGVLRDLDAARQELFLTRPIFEAAAFGRLKFHHSSVQEYLTACWLKKLTENGLSESGLWNFLTAETYAIRQVRPALRPVAAWLGQMHEPVRRRLLPLAPEILIEGGDPSLLPPDIRAQLLRSFARVYAGCDDSDISISIDQLVRLADPSLAGCIRDLWPEAKQSGELRELLLRLIWAGGIATCTDLALEAALNRRLPQYQRVSAIRAIEAAGTLKQKKQLVSDLIAKPRFVDKDILAAIAAAAFPDAMPAAALVGAITKIRGPRKKFEIDNLLYALESKLPDLDACLLMELNDQLLALLQTPPFIERRSIEISERYSWVLPILAAVCAETLPFLDKDGPPQSLIDGVRLSLKGDRYQLQYRLGDFAKNIRKAISGNHDLNRVFFWADVAAARKRHGDLDGYWGAYNFGGAWRLDRDDFEWLCDDAANLGNVNDRLVAVTAAYGALGDNAKGAPELIRLQAAVNGDKKLTETLNDLIDPPPRVESEQERRFKREDAIYKAQEERRRKKNATSWIALREKIIELGDDLPERITFGTLHDLGRWLQWAAGDRSRYGDIDATKLDAVFGRDTADGIRKAFKDQWRKFEAPLRSEKSSGGTPNGTIVGLIGLRIESDEDAGAVEGWTPRNARLATRYALDEMNGFPDWATELWSTRSRAVKPILAQEINWHFSRKSKSAEAPHYILDTLAYGDEAIIGAVSDIILAALEAKSPYYERTLSNSLRILLRAPRLDVRRFSVLARKRTQAGRSPEARRLLWLAAMMHTDAVTALTILQRRLEKQEPNVRGAFYMRFLSTMFDSREPGLGGVHRDFEQADVLEALVRLTYAYVRPEDDIEHDGVYSPGPRDHAENARNYLLGQLLDTPGRASYKALTNMAHDPAFAMRRERFLALARRRAAHDGDLPVFKPEDIHEFAQRHAAPPRNPRSLFERTTDVIDDIADEVMHGDYSLKEELRQDDVTRVDEKKIQNWFAGTLTNNSFGAFDVSREEEISDMNEPDVIVRRTGVNTRVPIEVKVADSWSIAKLQSAVIDQLIEKYMRPRNVNHGILFLTWHGKQQRWKNPANGRMINFDQLCAYLQSYADGRVDADYPSKTVIIKAADLTAKNLSRTTVKKSSKRKSAKKPARTKKLTSGKATKKRNAAARKPGKEKRSKA